MRPVLLLNGPNLNLLGQREPHLYGRETLADVEEACRAVLGHRPMEAFQTNHEGEMLERIHAARAASQGATASGGPGAADGIVINPGGWTHTSVALLDALNAFEGPVIEVHVSQVHRREAFRHLSYVSYRADAVIAGCGVQGYALAMTRMRSLLDAPARPAPEAPAPEALAPSAPPPAPERRSTAQPWYARRTRTQPKA